MKYSMKDSIKKDLDKRVDNFGFAFFNAQWFNRSDKEYLDEIYVYFKKQGFDIYFIDYKPVVKSDKIDERFEVVGEFGFNDMTFVACKGSLDNLVNNDNFKRLLSENVCDLASFILNYESFIGNKKIDFSKLTKEEFIKKYPQKVVLEDLTFIKVNTFEKYKELYEVQYEFEDKGSVSIPIPEDAINYKDIIVYDFEKEFNKQKENINVL